MPKYHEMAQWNQYALIPQGQDPYGFNPYSGYSVNLEPQDFNFNDVLNDNRSYI